MALLFVADECTGRAAVLLAPHHTKFRLPWICPILPSFSSSLLWTLQTHLYLLVSAAQQLLSPRIHTYAENSPQNTPSALHTNLLPFWAAGSTSCSWIAADQMLAAGWLSSNTAKFICLWFFSLPSKDRRQQQTRLAWANLKLSWQQQQEGKAAQ